MVHRKIISVGFVDRVRWNNQLQKWMLQTFTERVKEQALLKIHKSDKWYMYRSESVLENET